MIFLLNFITRTALLHTQLPLSMLADVVGGTKVSKELLECFSCAICKSRVYATQRGTADSVWCACLEINLNVKSKSR